MIVVVRSPCQENDPADAHTGAYSQCPLDPLGLELKQTPGPPHTPAHKWQNAWTCCAPLMGNTW